MVADFIPNIWEFTRQLLKLSMTSLFGSTQNHIWRSTMIHVCMISLQLLEDKREREWATSIEHELVDISLNLHFKGGQWRFGPFPNNGFIKASYKDDRATLPSDFKGKWSWFMKGFFIFSYGRWIMDASIKVEPFNANTDQNVDQKSSKPSFEYKKIIRQFKKMVKKVKVKKKIKSNLH